MSAAMQVALWALASVAPFMLAFFTQKLAALGLSTMLLLGWCMGRVLGVIYDWPGNIAFYPVIDLTFGWLAFLSWKQQHATWKLALVGLFLAQLAAHSAFWLAYEQATTQTIMQAIRYRYDSANNVLYALELLTVAWAGGVCDLARRALDWVPGGAGCRHHAGASR